MQRMRSLRVENDYSKKKLLNRHSEMFNGFEKPHYLDPGCHNTCIQLKQQMKQPYHSNQY